MALSSEHCNLDFRFLCELLLSSVTCVAQILLQVLLQASIDLLFEKRVFSKRIIFCGEEKMVLNKASLILVTTKLEICLKIRLTRKIIVVNLIIRLWVKTLSERVKENLVNRVRFSQVFLNLSTLILVSPSCRNGSRCIAV